MKLPATDKKRLHRHYKKKLKFYAIQDNTKWQNWPVKEVNKKRTNVKERKSRNFKKRQSRRTRQTKRDAKKVLDSGAVVVLVEEEIPPGAICSCPR